MVKQDGKELPAKLEKKDELCRPTSDNQGTPRESWGPH